MLNNIKITSLNQVENLGGDVFHAMKSSDVGYAGFGEAYFSFINYGSIKAWKRHTRMVMNLVVPVGRVKFVFHMPDDNSAKSFRVLEIGKDNYSRLTVPPGIWFGFQGLEKSQNLILNISDISHDPSEVERRTVNEIEYDWNLDK
jgi:dTDP-4-dehydrorhamnose 3,5-epimerase